MIDFPDTSDQEEPIKKVGRTELLRKRGEKILRVNQARWGGEAERYKYRYLLPYLSGRVLHLGVGIGWSLERIVERTEVTEIIAYEIEGDIIAIYESEHEDDLRLTFEAKNAHEHKPSGTFDTCFYELPMNSQETYDQSKAYLQWIWGRLNAGGCIILPRDRFSVALVGEFPNLNPMTIAVNDPARPSRRGNPDPIWLVVTK